MSGFIIWNEAEIANSIHTLFWWKHLGICYIQSLYKVDMKSLNSFMRYFNTIRLKAKKSLCPLSIPSTSAVPGLATPPPSPPPPPRPLTIKCVLTWVFCQRGSYRRALWVSNMWRHHTIRPTYTSWWPWTWYWGNTVRFVHGYYMWIHSHSPRILTAFTTFTIVTTSVMLTPIMIGQLRVKCS